jgi:hypothetical protein
VILSSSEANWVRYAAIMHGAVLHKLGLDFVMDRMMRASYGVHMDHVFRAGKDPEHRKFLAMDGVLRCKGRFDIYKKKVPFPLSC